ncbi:MAG: Fic family protein [Proteobacteria bacterium]|nr:Fic family protein [Pseudomonadota bacterium]
MTEIAAIEPMIPSDSGIDRSKLGDLALELERKASKLEGAINPVARQVVVEHMRIINSYYSNLIEGNNTHPRDIRRAMDGEYHKDQAKRDLQIESVAHINTQRKLDEESPTAQYLISPDYFLEIHRHFYEQLPESLRIVLDFQDNRAVVNPGVFRQAGEDVQVGRHVPPASEDLANYFVRFQQAYRLDRLHGQRKVIAAMASHHRFSWIHPFLDGNGRVGRLHTDQFLKHIGLGAYGIWCISRGLARRNSEYKSALARADFPRQGDRDGRGALSEKTLVEFCEFMLDVCIDQVDYMASLIDLQGMEKRIQSYIEDRSRGLLREVGSIKPEAARLLQRAFTKGEFERSEMAGISGLGQSVTRKLVQQLKREGLLTETSSRSPLRWAIPNHVERYYFPELSP